MVDGGRLVVSLICASRACSCMATSALCVIICVSMVSADIYTESRLMRLVSCFGIGRLGSDLSLPVSVLAGDSPFVALFIFFCVDLSSFWLSNAVFLLMLSAFTLAAFLLNESITGMLSRLLTWSI